MALEQLLAQTQDKLDLGSALSASAQSGSAISQNFRQTDAAMLAARQQAVTEQSIAFETAVRAGKSLGEGVQRQLDNKVKARQMDQEDLRLRQAASNSRLRALELGMRKSQFNREFTQKAEQFGQQQGLRQAEYDETKRQTQRREELGDRLFGGPASRDIGGSSKGPDEVASPSALDALRNAQKFVGKDFKAGQTKRCADFMCAVFGDNKPAGVGVSAKSWNTAAVGPSVSLEKAQAGDVVVFTDTYPGPNKETHVGIIGENGKFVHRPTADKPVREDSLTDGYYSSRIYNIRRPGGTTSGRSEQTADPARAQTERREQRDAEPELAAQDTEKRGAVAELKVGVLKGKKDLERAKGGLSRLEDKRLRLDKAAKDLDYPLAAVDTTRLDEEQMDLVRQVEAATEQIYEGEAAIALAEADAEAEKDAEGERLTPTVVGKLVTDFKLARRAKEAKDRLANLPEGAFNPLFETIKRFGENFNLSTLNEDKALFTAVRGGLTNLVLKEQSGAAVSNQEFDRFVVAVGDPTKLTEETFRAVTNKWFDDIVSDYTDTLDIYEDQGYRISGALRGQTLQEATEEASTQVNVPALSRTDYMKALEGKRFPNGSGGYYTFKNGTKVNLD